MKLAEKTFGPKISNWLDRQNQPTNKATLEATVKSLAEDPRLREQLTHLSGEHPMTVIIRRCLDLDLDLGTRNLRTLHKELQKVGVSSADSGVALNSFILLSASSQHPAVQELVASPNFSQASKEDRFVELVLTLEKYELLGTSQHLGNIYSGLPADIKEQVAKINLPLAELKSLRDGLANDKVRLFLESKDFNELPKGDRFIELVFVLDAHGLLGECRNLGSIYSGLPAVLKEQAAKIDLPFSELKHLREGVAKESVKQLLRSKDFAALSKEDRFIELILNLEKYDLLGVSQNLGSIYSGLPATLKRQVAYINLPLSELKSLREGLANEGVKEFLGSNEFKDLSKEDRFVELILTLEKYQLLGASQNLGNIYSGLPASLKKQVTQVRLPLAELKSLREGLTHDAVKQLLGSEEFIDLSKEDRFIELVLTLEKHNLLGSGHHLAGIYSGFPASLKKQVTQINLPLAELKSLREGLTHEAVKELLGSQEFIDLPKEDRFIELVLALEKHQLLGSSQHLGHIYSGLPRFLKQQVTQINQSLADLKAIRSFLANPETIKWLETFLLTYPKEERLEVLRCRYVNQTAQQISRNKLFQALPHQVSPSLFKWDFTTSCCRLDLADQTVFFDSGEERVVAQLLHKYGLILKFIEGENLHIRVGDSRSTLDFKVGNVFIEYHPLSMSERDEGITIEEAGERKRARLDCFASNGNGI